MQGGSPGFKSQRVHSRDLAVTESCPLRGRTRYDESRTTEPMHHPAKAWMGRVERARCHRERHEIVCTCNPGVHWTRSTESKCAHPLLIRLPSPTRATSGQITNWLLYWLVNGSAREPMTDVPSCEKLREAAWRRRTGDLRMGIPLQLLRAMGNAPN